MYHLEKDPVSRTINRNILTVLSNHTTVLYRRLDVEADVEDTEDAKVRTGTAQSVSVTEGCIRLKLKVELQVTLKLMGNHRWKRRKWLK